MSVVISGSGLYTPQDTISNEELVNSFNQYVELFNQAHQTEIQNGTCTALEYSSSAFIEKASGIKQRYVVDKVGVLDPKRMRPYIPQRNDSEMSLQCEMSLKAIYPALDQAQVEGHQIDAIIVACSNFQRPYPALAIEIQAALKCHGFGFDMNVACSSATFGIAAAKSLIESGQCQHAIVVNPEICSGHLDFTDRESHFIFGDACTAVVLQNDSAAKVPHFKILDSKLTTQFSNNIRNNNGFLTHTEAKSAELPLHLFKQQGRRVFKEVTPLVAEHILEQLHDLQLSPQHMKRMWLHQANRTMNELICKRVLNTEFREQEAPIILDQYANTSSAGSIISFHNHHADLQAGDRGLICSFGAGYSIGSIVLEKALNMNLYFRLIWLLIRLPFMGKLKDPLSDSHLFMRVWPFDLDLNFHVNNGRYLTMMDLGRIHLTGLNGMLWFCLKRRWMPVIGSAKIHFLKPLNCFNVFKLTTKVVYWDEKWFYIEQSFYRNDELYVTALVKGLFTSRQGKIAPDQIISALNLDVTKPQMPESIARWIQCEKG